MGLFDQVLGNRQTTTTDLSPAEAFAAITIIAIASDGYFADEEVNAIHSSLMRMQLFKAYPADMHRRMYDKLFGLMRRDGVPNLLNTAKSSLPFELRESAFAVATDLVLADGTVTREEENFLNDLCRVLELNQERALKIVEVMSIKNRG
jgi:hypothetical protein